MYVYSIFAVRALHGFRYTDLIYNKSYAAMSLLKRKLIETLPFRRSFKVGNYTSDTKL